MRVGIPKEIHPGERRVAATPNTVARLRKMGFEVVIEAGAGLGARYSDAAYTEAGASVVGGAAALWQGVELVLKVRPPTPDEVGQMPDGQHLISLLYPAQNADLVKQLAARKATVIALDAIPRISRAQKMDVLSSMANIAGYRAVIEAANCFGSFFGGQITAAGKTAPAKVLIIGAGVAGLAAIGAARSMGAVVRAFDVRPSVKEQIQSMGAEFLEVEIQESGEGVGGYAKTMSKEFIEAEMALFRRQAKEVDIVITTALIPGKRAPILWTRDMVESMKPGSVVVDLAAEQGGNCEYTVPGEATDAGGVTVIGYTDLPSRLATHASQFFASNICHLLDDMGGGANYHVDHEDEAVRGALIVDKGEILPPPTPKAAPPAAATAAQTAVAHAPPKPPESKAAGPIATLLSAVGLTLLGVYAPSEFLQHFTVFVLACFVGWQVVWNVTPALHTPLMSVTNAISGIILVGGMLQAASGQMDLAAVLGAVAIAVASINVAGGFLVTQRMLKMFRLN